MSDIQITLSVPTAMQVQSAIEAHLTMLNDAAATGRLRDLALDLNAYARRELEAAHGALTEALYSDLPTEAEPIAIFFVDDRPEPCFLPGHVHGCPGRAGGDHEAVSA